MKCENCGNEHDGSYGSGRFCSKHCGCSFNAKQVKNRSLPRPHKRSKLGTWKCWQCGLVFDTRKLLTKHKHEVHHPPMRKYAWNKGLTKETCESIRKRSETIAKRMAAGEIKPSMKG